MKGMEWIFLSWLFIILVTKPLPVWAQNASTQIQEAEQWQQKARELAENNQLLLAIDALHNALKTLERTKPDVSETQKKRILKLRRSSLCNIGYFSRQMGLWLQARDYYRRCSTIEITAQQKEKTERTLTYIQKQIRKLFASLAVYSTPSGAQIKITPSNAENEAGIQVVTPVTVDLEPGTYTIELNMSGYQTIRQPIVLQQGTQVERHFTLIQPVDISLTSEPTKVSVRLIYANGSELPGHTPWHLRLLPGQYTAILSKHGYKTQRIAFVIKNGKSLRQHYVMMPLHGKISIITEPPGAKIQLRDALKRQHIGVSPWKVHVPLGKLHITIAKPNYIPIAKHIEITEKIQIKRHFVLIPYRSARYTLAPSLAWTATGLAVASLTAGTILILQSMGDFQKLAKLQQTPSSLPSEIEAVYYRGYNMQMGGIFAFAAGGVFTAGAVVLFLWRFGKIFASQSVPSTKPSHMSSSNHTLPLPHTGILLWTSAPYIKNTGEIQ
jgi:tetratricopeptide (TPR) repeat protein